MTARISELLSVAQVADILEVSEPEVRALIATKQLPAAPFVEAMCTRIYRSDVTRYIADLAVSKAYHDAARRQREAAADRLELAAMEHRPDLAHTDFDWLGVDRRPVPIVVVVLGAALVVGALAVIAIAVVNGWWPR